VKRYPAYKDSGATWLGKIPVHWNLLPNIALFKERIQRGYIDALLLSVTQDRGIIRQTDLLEKKDSSNENKSNYKLVCVGDIAYNKMRMWQGAVGYSDYEGIVSPAYVVLYARAQQNQKYFYYLFKLPAYNNYSKTFSYGITDDQLSLRFSEFKRMYSPAPPPSEQDAIVAYLNRKLADIDLYIANKQKQIKLLQEQKTAVINRAVTRGLDPNAELKPSGIEWLGDVPAHWELKRNKQIFREIVDRSATGNETRLSMSQKLGLVATDSIEETPLQSESREGYKVCQVNDLVLNRLKAHLGVFARSTIPGSVSPDYTVFRLKIEADIRYFESLYRHPAYIGWFNKAVHGVTVGFWRLYTQDFNDITALFPPPDEQRQIVEFLNDESAKLNNLIAQIVREIELMQEYRTVLIAEAVTGKIDCRNNAEGL